MTGEAPAVSGNQKRKMRSAARLYAVQALFQMEAAGQTVDKVIVEFEDHRFGAVYEGDEMQEGDPSLFRKIMRDAVNWQAKIDQMTDRALVAKWPIGRIDPTLRALFRAAGGDRGICRHRQGLLPGGQGAEIRQRRARPHGARGEARGVLSLFHLRHDRLAPAPVGDDPQPLAVDIDHLAIGPRPVGAVVEAEIAAVPCPGTGHLGAVCQHAGKCPVLGNAQSGFGRDHHVAGH